MSRKDVPAAAAQPSAEDLQRVIDAKDRELEETYALVNYYKDRADALDLQFVNARLELKRCESRIAELTVAAEAAPTTN